MHNIYTKIVAGIHKYFKENGFDKAVIGVSGGIDSALCLKLTVDALGPDNVTAILMPEKGVSSDENYLHSKTLCQFLKVEFFSVPINKFLMDFLSLPWKPSDLGQINTKARVRMIVWIGPKERHTFSTSTVATASGLGANGMTTRKTTVPFHLG